ncbi:hypothetical protein CFC21_106026 [Triticum aestivum]|uniref:NB-ARC domain-containing protein n=2 Tax=Triticum aestivum TaxID=4565 RepID=A0A3B6SU59_WHEAT|nr:hypothetical protein CFC21_106026 [Triticum aestivum]
MIHIKLISYWDLPHQLKTCLLYLCIYPEDWRISCEELKWKWIAEGFIATKHGSLYQDAESCFNELVNRRLIHLVAADGFEKKYCQVHDMVLDLIISLSDQENFATILNSICNSLPNKIHRISLQSSGHEQKGVIQAITRSKLHVRSLNLFGETKKIPPLVDFQSMHVLDICVNYESWENKDIRNIGSFYQLRYLRIQNAGITKLPEDIGKLQHLETLDLQDTLIQELPSTTAQLKNLMRLFVRFKCVLFANMSGSMRALEEVSDICIVDNPEKFLEELVHLTKLRKIMMTGSWTECYGERLASYLKGLGNDSLQYLFNRGQIGEYLFSDPCSTFPNLQNLVLVLPLMRVPKGMASLTNIIKLDIQVRLFDDEGLHILMGMPSLANLRLDVLDQLAGALTISRNGFKLLVVFHYTINADGTTGIKFAAGAMPALRCLELTWKARYFPLRTSDGADVGLELLSSLAEIQVETSCYDATLDEVEGVEGFVAKAIALYPNHLQIGLSRRHEEMIMTTEKSENEEEESRRRARVISFLCTASYDLLICPSFPPQ